jgi:hypothetical protein
MKKIALLVVAVAFTAMAGAQVVVGLQGGYHQQTEHNDFYRIDVPAVGDITTYDQKSTTWLGGLQVGYQITRKLYAGVVGQYSSTSGSEVVALDRVFVDERAHSAFQGMYKQVEDHTFRTSQTAWYAGVQVKYELMRYGNMHFNILLQGTYGRHGYTYSNELYTKSGEFSKTNDDGTKYTEKGELEDFGSVADGNRDVTIDVSLRPTLVYEFSEHLSAELSLDFLSVGYVKNTRYVDAYTKIDDGSGNLVALIDPHQEEVTTLYAGLNTLMQTLDWESPMLRLGFNWKF